MSTDLAYRRWLSLHVYYFDPLDRLIREAVGPLVDGLRRGGRIDGFFFVRYWQGGPHLRLRILPARDEAGGEARDGLDAAVTAGLRGYLSASPSGTRLDPAGYRRLSELLSRSEPGRPGIEPLHPDNSIRRVPYLPELATYGGVAAMPDVERHFTESSEIVLDALRLPLSSRERFGLAVAMLAQAGLAADPIRSGTERLLVAKHRLWLDSARPAADLMNSWETGYRGQRERLARLAGYLVGANHPAVGAGAALERWRASVALLAERLAGLAAAGRLTSPWRDGPSAVLLACLHMHLNRLGLSLPEEAQANYLALRALEAQRAERSGERR